MESHGTVIVTRECHWRLRLKSIQNISTHIPRILVNDTEATLLKAIDDGSVFGFITCDVETPLEIIQERETAGFLFPPVIQRVVVKDKHLSPFMRENMLKQKKKLR